jgi:nucleotide-binding universal stress UspA family protein
VTILRSFANKKGYGRPPDQKILEYAKKNEIELIVRGTEHHSSHRLKSNLQ